MQFTTAQDQTTNIHQTAGFDIRIYPNPVKNVLFIESEMTIKRVEIRDMTGKQVLSQTQAPTLGISELSAGIYFLTVHFEEGEKTFRIMKQ